MLKIIVTLRKLSKLHEILREKNSISENKQSKIKSD